MNRIYKYQVFLGSPTEIGLPVGAEILSVGMQGRCIQMWARVDTDRSLDRETRRFHVFGTGHDLPEVPLRFLGTVLQNGGEFVWHVFEETE